MNDGEGGECPYGNSHGDLLVWASDYVETNRRRLGLEEPWSIVVRVVCPTLGKSIPYEGKITWDSEVWYATIDLLCTLPGALVEWVLVHELCELKYWRTGDAFHALTQQLSLTRVREMAVRRYSEARNQEIEIEVGQFLAARRPGHLVASDEPFSLERWWTKDKDGGTKVDVKGLIAQLQEWREESGDDEEENPYPDIVTITPEENTEEHTI